MQTDSLTVWDFLIALSGLTDDDYIGRFNPDTKDLDVKPLSEIQPHEKVIDLAERRNSWVRSGDLSPPFAALQ